MDVKTVLLAYILPGLAVVLGLPMALGLIPPNRWYGFRTRKTLSSPAIWYPANRYSGWALTIAGAIAIAHNALLLHDHPDWSPATQQLVMTLSMAFLMLVSQSIAGLYVRKL